MTQTSAPRRIAVVCDAVEPWNTGGKERRHHEILSRLAARGYAVDIHTMNWWGSAPRTTIGELNYHALSRHRPLYAGPRRSIKQAALFALSTVRMLGRPFDVLEADAIPFLQLFPLRIVTWLRRKPMVVTWHEYWGKDYWVEYLGRPGYLAAFVERMAIRMPDRIIAASQATAERLNTLAPAGLDVRVVPNGIDVSGVRELAATKRPQTDTLQLISIGRLLDNKKVDETVRAAAVLRDQGVSAQLTIIGEGPQAARINQLIASLGLSDRVTMRSFLPEHRDVLGLLAASDVLLFPSVREGFGMAALEAMAVGTPVITSDHPDNLARHLVENGVSGVVCPPTGEALARAVLDVAAHRDEFGQAALATAQNFDWDRLSDEAAKAYDS